MKLNIGSGQRKFGDGWTNIDSQPKWSPDIVADATDLKRHVPDGAAELIMLHHVYEHFGEDERRRIVAECQRMLAPGGALIVIVPDVDAIVRGYISGRLTLDLLLINLYGAWMGDGADRHKWGFTWGSLRKELARFAPDPWAHIGAFDWRALEGADVAAKDFWFFGVEVTR